MTFQELVNYMDRKKKRSKIEKQILENNRAIVKSQDGKEILSRIVRNKKLQADLRRAENG